MGVGKKIMVPIVLGIACTALMGSSPVDARTAGVDDELFQAFTSYINRHIVHDKKAFVEAETCTRWFYEQHKEKPQPAPQVHPTGLRPRLVSEASECANRYPSGIKGAREDFSRTQSSLSFSLTFYELALVGDGNDDGRYNAGEVKDMMESFGLPFQENQSPALYLAALNGRFDWARQRGDLEMVMNSLDTLQQRGYRFTTRDKVELNRILG